MSSPYQKTYFLLSVAEIKQLPPDIGLEVAIVGRSNAGKSSVLNRITQSKRLARVSKTPGRTQHVNMFVIDEKRRIADLPGYGYAKVPLAAKEKWQKTVDAYIRKRESLRGLLLIMDIRHPLKETDRLLLEYCNHIGLPVHILLNKSDKLSRGAADKVLHEIKAALREYGDAVTCQCFSAETQAGMKELRIVLDKWYQF